MDREPGADGWGAGTTGTTGTSGTIGTIATTATAGTAATPTTTTTTFQYSVVVPEVATVPEVPEVPEALIPLFPIDQPMPQLRSSNQETFRDCAEAAWQHLQRLPRFDAPSIREVRRRWSKLLSDRSPQFVLGFVDHLLALESAPACVVAFEVLAGHPHAFAKLKTRRITAMASKLSGWGLIDLFGVTVAGKAWREGILEDDAIRSWTKSPNHWMRRLALVATVPLNSKSRGGAGDAIRTLDICGRLLSDRNFMVVKALSWALRALAKRDPSSVEEFLAEEGQRMPALVRREVMNKLKYGTKAIPRRR